jgi:hypothetical protein
VRPAVVVWCKRAPPFCCFVASAISTPARASGSRAAECVYWMHPENTCPNPGSHSQPPLIGTCNNAGCDCVEWYHQVVLILAGQEPSWMADSIPRSLDGLRATLSSEFLEMVAGPAYHQLQAPLTYTYLLSDGPACPLPSQLQTRLTSAPSRAPSPLRVDAVSGWLRADVVRKAINHQRQERNRYLSTDQPPPKQPHEADHCSAGAGSAGQSKQRAGSGAG